MKTTLSSDAMSVDIDTDGPLTIIGEKINPTGRKRLAATLKEGDLDYVVELAVRQVEAGADVLDINVGVPGIDEVKKMREVVSAVSSAVDVPLCIDSPNHESVAAGLEACPGRPLVNSVNGEERSMSAILPLVKKHDAAVIGLTLDEDGIPETAEARFAVAKKIIDRAESHGIPLESIVIDPLVLTVGADSDAAKVTLETIALLTAEYGININLGASNVSFGLPDRHTVNQAFLGMAMGAGASCAITDVAKMAPTIRAADLLRGRDPHGMRYIKYFRAHPPQDER
ncbi:MAG: methyltetrahydrofolate cobalamin methyltransferase [Acidimicrobiia bacterium]|nr:MAG: methyltetrahydrofolate cobalamin methyltransferase [Acidimicrobiia bacterium]